MKFQREERIVMRLREELPELEGATMWLNSAPLTRGDLIGSKPLLLYFWSISCESCKKMMPQMNQLYEEYDDQLNILSVHMPRSEDDVNIEQIQETALEHELKHPIFVDNEHQLTDKFRNHYVPSFYIFDKQGRLRYRHTGEGGRSMLTRRLNRLMND